MASLTIKAAANVERQRARRAAKASKGNVEIEWFIRNVSDKVNMTMRQRMDIAMEMLANQIVKNISVPVGRGSSRITGRVVVTERSKAGEFPRAEHSRLMKDVPLTKVVTVVGGGVEGLVGTSLDYGLILELKRDRSFLVKTFNAMRKTMLRILTGPMK